MRVIQSAWFWVATGLAFVALIAGWLLRNSAIQARALAAITARHVRHGEESSKAETLKATAAKHSKAAEKHLAKAGAYADSATQAYKGAQAALRVLRDAKDRDAFVETFNRLSGPRVRNLDPNSVEGSVDP